MKYWFDGFIFINKFDSNFPGYKKKGIYVPLHNYIYWLKTGNIPVKGKTVIHHRDEDRTNNKFDNLALMSVSKHASKHYKPLGNHDLQTRKKISFNSNSKGMFGYKGSQIDKRVKPENKAWRAKIKYNGTQTTLGYFIDPLSAEIVYKIVREEIYGQMSE